jgi:hypothetical protein
MRGFAGFSHRGLADFADLMVIAGFSHRVLSDFRESHDFAGFSHRVLSDFRGIRDFCRFFASRFVNFSRNVIILQDFRIAFCPIFESVRAFRGLFAVPACFCRIFAGFLERRHVFACSLQYFCSTGTFLQAFLHACCSGCMF